jgi:hypothetical protein
VNYLNPAPWTYEGETDPALVGPPPQHCVYDATGHTIVGAFYFEASARQAAAAPDLYQALHALRYGRLPNHDEPLLPNDIRQLVDAALAKAGETP